MNFGFFGSGLCFDGVFPWGGGFEEEREQNLITTLDGLDFGIWFSDWGLRFAPELVRNLKRESGLRGYDSKYLEAFDI